MKTLQDRIFHRLFLLLTTIFVLAGSSTIFAQGKKVYVGTGSGFIDYPNAQTTLNLQDEDTVMINPGKYKLMNFRNITASPGHRIYIMNSGQVEFNDPSPSTFSNLTNVTISGSGTSGIEFGFYMHDLIKAISIDGTMSGVYFSYIKMVNIADYCIFMFNPSLVYNGTNNSNSLYYDLKFLHFSVYNIMTTFLQVGVYTRIVDDGLINMMRKLEVAYCTVDYTDQEDVLHLNKVVNADIHHNRFSHLGKNDFRHTGIVYLYGNGDVHHNYISDYWGSGLRAHSFSLDSVGAVNVYDNIMVNSRKYSGVEAQCTPEDIAFSPYLHYCNFKIYNNTFGNLSAYDWNCSMIDTYNAVGGTIEIKNNLGFNIQRDKPYNPAWNYVFQQLNITKPDTARNLYSPNYLDLGLADDSSCMLNVNSPAIDKGLSFGLIKDDINGIARPQGLGFDIGAREYLSGIVYPVANAGADSSLVLPKDSVSLNASASYNPGGGVLTYKWSQVAGPSAAVFVADTMVKPLVKNLVQGVYQFKVTVTNSQAHSNEDIVVIVVSLLPVFPPVAKAGGNITITLPVNSTSIDGTASTSTGGALTYTWTKTSGPASFIMSGDSTGTPYISSLTEGTYQVKLTVTDTNHLSSSNVATIIVNPAPVPVANAGTDISLVLPVNSTTLNGSASTTPAGGGLSYTWTKISGPGSFIISGDTTANPNISNLVEGAYQIKLTVTNTSGISNSDFVNIVVSAAPVAVANAGVDVNVTLPTGTAVLNGSASYSTGGGALVYEWSQVSGPSVLTISGGNTATPNIGNLQAGVYQVKLKVTNVESASAEDLVNITVSAVPVYPPVSNAGADIAITLPTNSASLNGEQSYNPGGGTLTYSWSFLSGTSSPTITGAATATPVISNLTEGAYQVKLTVTNDQGASAEDTVSIAVSPVPATPPVASAGADKTITLPANTAVLDGSGSSNAAGGTLTYAWSLASGPSSFSILGETTASPTLSNLVQGVYHVKLVVTNARGLSAEDVVTITVNPAAPPVANAGHATESLVLPQNTITLDGSGSYDPSGSSLAYSWSKTAGPGTFTITGNATAAPTISNLVMGTYQFTLTVTNAGGSTASGAVNIIVTPSLLAVPNTGRDTTINFPNGYAILDGSSSYEAGTGAVLHYRWHQVSGPAAAVIANNQADKTTATSLEPGVYNFQLAVTDDYGQTATTTFKVTVVSATHNLKSISLYPNPCADQLHIHAIADSTGPAIVRITSMSGIVMMRQIFQKNQLIFDQQVTVSQLPAGTYILEVIIGKEVSLLDKFIKR
ncbi:MAG: PKD domain-containing protein [Bacteroidota bacterium]